VAEEEEHVDVVVLEVVVVLDVDDVDWQQAVEVVVVEDVLDDVVMEAEEEQLVVGETRPDSGMITSTRPLWLSFVYRYPFTGSKTTSAGIPPTVSVKATLVPEIATTVPALASET
jgi:hypothetical protein